ncbi:MAG: DNA-binding response regulator in two-component regulatory system with KdpD [Candidatus Nitrospira kreftii]|jgi:two-component system, OmpR family, KDP operon response regulator KdpE|uniref:DNA-binding response regulator in two-component regulatory system with KdpD n=1 Tax=Candidatus Nitrospira kreftii TaxID=2652173 RepID=A0A7S8FBQ7_9BACT|nr:MAG: DNA-binding response regulator in two-component regulatory system with KdpD [Candidatus Nitrospira kreftii]
MSQEATILLIEDEPEIRRFLRTTLPVHGFRLYEAATGRDGLTEAQARNPDLILLDLGLPDLEGSEVIRRVREWTATPIIVLSARDQEQVKVAALDLGADDYVTKPFGVNELLARMRAALRHAAQSADAPESVFVLHDLKVDLGRRQVFVLGKEVHLTPIEYKLFTTLIRYAGKVLTHRQLLKEVWGPLHVEEGHYLRVYMRQLRNKLEKNPAHPRYLVTELGVGYRLRAE